MAVSTEMRELLSELRFSFTSVVATAGLITGLTACGRDTPAAPRSFAQTYWALRLDQHAVTLALTPPYDTIRLHPIAIDPLGDTLPMDGVVRYITADSSIAVNPTTGLVTAKYSTLSRGTPTYIIASLQDTVTRFTATDTVFVQVTPTAPTSPLTSFSAQLDPSDTNTHRPIDPLGFSPTTLVPMLRDGTGTSMSSNILVAFTSSDPHIAAVDSRSIVNPTVSGGNVSGVRSGTVAIHAETWAYGVAKRDSITLTFTDINNTEITVVSKTPYGSLTPVLYFSPPSITLVAGGVVTWLNSDNTDSIDVVFDDPANVDSAAALNFPDFYPYTGRGNFTGLYNDTTSLNNGDFDTYIFHILRARSFPVPGTYHYHSTIYGSTGTIVVR